MKVRREDHWKPQSPVREGGVVYANNFSQFAFKAWGFPIYSLKQLLESTVNKKKLTQGKEEEEKINFDFQLYIQYISVFQLIS